MEGYVKIRLAFRRKYGCPGVISARLNNNRKIIRTQITLRTFFVLKSNDRYQPCFLTSLNLCPERDKAAKLKAETTRDDEIQHYLTMNRTTE